MELKFRAWHKEWKTYHGVYSIMPTIEEIEIEVSLVKAKKVYFDEVIIEQYLEYDEHNKRDVYVGDIYWDDRCQDYFIVVWNEYHHAVGYSWVYDNSIDLNWEGISIDNRYVGNVHENKELLK